VHKNNLTSYTGSKAEVQDITKDTVKDMTTATDTSTDCVTKLKECTKNTEVMVVQLEEFQQLTDNLDAELSTLQGEASQCTKKLLDQTNKQETEKAKCINDIEHRQKLHQSLSSNYVRQTEKTKELETKVEQLTQRINTLENNITSLEDKLRKSTAELEDSGRKLEEQIEQNTFLQTEIVDLQQQLNEN
jgi:chromosome segregation ATPase